MECGGRQTGCSCRRLCTCACGRVAARSSAGEQLLHFYAARGERLREERRPEGLELNVRRLQDRLHLLCLQRHTAQHTTHQVEDTRLSQFCNSTDSRRAAVHTGTLYLDFCYRIFIVLFIVNIHLQRTFIENTGRYAKKMPIHFVHRIKHH